MTQKILSYILNVKNFDHPENRLTLSIFSGFVGLVFNFGLLITKIILGCLSGSFSIILDGIHNGFDCLSSILSIVAYKISSRPANKKNPYGYGRIEYILTFVIAMIIIFCGIEFIEVGFERILEPKPITYSPYYIMVIFITILVEFGLYFYYMQIYKITQSTSFKALAIDALSDAVLPTITLIPLLTSHLYAIYLDGYITLGISIFIMFQGIKIIKELLSTLLGKANEDNHLDKILTGLKQFNFITGIDEINIHNYGVKKDYITLNIHLAADTDYNDANAQIKIFKHEIERTYNTVFFYHLEPSKIYSKKMIKQLEKIRAFLLEDQHVNTYEAIQDFIILESQAYLWIICKIKNEDERKEYREYLEWKLQALFPKWKWQVHVIGTFIE